MALSAYFRESPLEHIVSITITGTVDEQFLYSDTNGMLGSKDGFTWVPAAGSVPAVAMAYGEGVWVAAGAGGELWRSEDYTKTWESVSTPSMNTVAYIKPANSKPDEPGVFAGCYRLRNTADGFVIYASFDLGKTWQHVYTPPYGYYLFVNSFNGSGGKFFICTDEAEEGMQQSGYAHVSSDGRSWSRISTFPGGTPVEVWEYQLTRGCHNVEFDKKTETYYCVGWHQEADGIAQTTTNSAVYATSGNGLSFSGASIIQSSFIPRGGGGNVVTPDGHSIGAGMGTFATMLIYSEFTGDIARPQESYVQATVGPGGQTLFNEGNLFDGSHIAQASPIGVRFGVTNKDTGAGVFVCAGFDLYLAGGIWTSTGGGWTQTHTGMPFHDANQNADSAVGLAVGKVVLASEVTPPEAIP